MKVLTAVLVLAIAVLTTFDVVAADTATTQPELTAAQVRMAIQAICPVTGNKLGSHGDPVLVKIGEEQIYLCCKGCATGKIDPAHWATIHKNFAKAQGICPVMRKELPENPKWTMVEGRIIYVCCPPCMQKIKADPDTYVNIVDKLYLASLKKGE